MKKIQKDFDLKKHIEHAKKIQDELNRELAGRFWLSGEADNGKRIYWDVYIRLEIAELVDCFPIKHFKDTSNNVDIKNLLIEGVDILHFLLSKEIYNERHEKLELKIEALLTHANALSKENDGQSLSIQALNQGDLNLAAGFALGAVLHYWTTSDIFELYRGKAVLNKFRREHGYREGTYRKIWNGKEDNKIMFDMLIDKKEDIASLYENLEYLYEEDSRNK